MMVVMLYTVGRTLQNKTKFTEFDIEFVLLSRGLKYILNLLLLLRTSCACILHH